MYSLERAALKQKISIYIFGIICFLGCKTANEETQMEKEEKELVEMCLKFAKRADALEKRAYENGEYRLKGFFPDFNRLFDEYAHGTMNRTKSGLNFRNPPRYNTINTSINTVVDARSKTRYHVTFEGTQKRQSIRFVIDEKQSEWKLIHFETYVGIANNGDEIWTKQKL